MGKKFNQVKTAQLTSVCLTTYSLDNSSFLSEAMQTEWILNWTFFNLTQRIPAIVSDLHRDSVSQKKGCHHNHGYNFVN